jgi:hypothetical protein
MRNSSMSKHAAMLLSGCVFGVLGLTSELNAATQGSQGATSTGTVTINASVSARVDITNLSDITFADADLGPVINTGSQATKAENVCVWSNNADKSYYVTASGSGTAGAFTLANSTNPVIPYEVYWSATSGQTTGTALLTGVKSAKLTGTATLPNCGGGTSSSLIVGIQGSDANSMLAATAYTGTLTLLVAPN